MSKSKTTHNPLSETANVPYPNSHNGATSPRPGDVSDAVNERDVGMSKESKISLRPLAPDVQNTYKQLADQFSLFFLIGTVFLAVIFSGLQFTRDTLESISTAETRTSGPGSIYSLPFFFGFLALTLVFMTCVLSFVNAGIMAFAAAEGPVGLLVPNYWYRLRFCYGSMLTGLIFFITSLALVYKDYLSVAQNVIIVVVLVLTIFLAASDAYVPLSHFVRLRAKSGMDPDRDLPRAPPAFYSFSRLVPPYKWYLPTPSQGYLGKSRDPSNGVAPNAGS
ncbi:hypothetical protein HGRIS_000228 [Hohenbuehelia grisea]|uniref:Uncharacterized protein n=1 Tax=Hohenbuehelia grisea TaxID=104357 RepID=A0ABR3JQL3_9AGAR